jgi:hypothetical protein
MTKLGLTLNEVKTSVKDARTERFDFLGYTFGPHCYQRNGNRYLGASPSKKSVERVKTRINGVLVPGNLQPWTEVRNPLNLAASIKSPRAPARRTRLAATRRFVVFDFTPCDEN